MLPKCSPQRRTRLECLLRDGKSVQWTMSQRARGSTWEFSPYCRRCLVSKEANFAFLNQDALWLVSVHWVAYPLHPWCFQMLAFDVCKICILPCSYQLAMCWYSLIWQIRNLNAKSDPSSTKNTFGLPFNQRKLHATHQCSARKRQDIGVFAIMIGDVDMGKSKHGFPEQKGIGDGVHIWRWMYEKTAMLEISWFLEFIRWPFCPVCKN